MISEKELRRLRANPLGWLRSVMTDSHAQKFPPHLIEQECWRIVHATACRWLGEGVNLDCPQLDIGELAWVQPGGGDAAEADMPRPLDAKPEKPASPKNPLDARALERRDTIFGVVKPLYKTLKPRHPTLYRPEITLLPGVWVAFWSKVGLSVAISGPSGEPVTHVSVIEGDDSYDLPYTTENFSCVWSVFQAVQTPLLDG